MFSLEFSNQAKRFLKGLDRHLLDRIMKRLENLGEEPVPSDARFIGRESGEKVFRYGIGDYRVLYKLKGKNKVVLIIKIDKRPRAYQ